MEKRCEIRLQKIIAQNDTISRRKAEELILKGNVQINGRIAKLGDKADIKYDKIIVNGNRLQYNKKFYYFMLNKPRGYLSTTCDKFDRKCVTDLIKIKSARLFPVGRLDKDSEGLLLMTNDGKFANDVIHPSNKIPKKYRVTIRQKITDEQLEKLRNGVMVDGMITLPAKVNLLLRNNERSVIEMTIKQGRNRQIRKMCEAMLLEVKRLKRIQIGCLRLGMLKPGDSRELTQNDIKKIFLKEGDNNDIDITYKR